MLPRLLPAMLALLAAGLLAGFPAVASAQGVQVSPVTLDMAPGQQVATITVTNHADQPVSIQVRAFAWTQPAGQDTLLPTPGLAISPPIFDIPAGQSQLVRLLLRATPHDSEAAYRLLFDQLPAAGSPGVTLALRLSVPLFAEPAEFGAPNLDLRVLRHGAAAELVALNRGTRHDRLLAPVLLAGLHRFGLATNTNFYVLAGSEQHWPVAGDAAALRPGQPAQLTASTVAGRLDRPVTVLGH